MSGGCGGGVQSEDSGVHSEVSGEKRRKRVFATSSESDEEFPQVRDATAVGSREVRDGSAGGCARSGQSSSQEAGVKRQRFRNVELSGWGAVIGVAAAGAVRGAGAVQNKEHLQYLVDKTRVFAEVSADNHADAVGGGRINEVLSEAVWVREAIFGVEARAVFVGEHGLGAWESYSESAEEFCGGYASGCGAAITVLVGKFEELVERTRGGAVDVDVGSVVWRMERGGSARRGFSLAVVAVSVGGGKWWDLEELGGFFAAVCGARHQAVRGAVHQVALEVVREAGLDVFPQAVREAVVKAGLDAPRQAVRDAVVKAILDAPRQVALEVVPDGGREAVLETGRGAASAVSHQAVRDAVVKAILDASPQAVREAVLDDGRGAAEAVRGAVLEAVCGNAEAILKIGRGSADGGLKTGRGAAAKRRRGAVVGWERGGFHQAALMGGQAALMGGQALRMGGQAAGHEDGHEDGHEKCVLIDLSQSDDETFDKPCVALEKAAVPNDDSEKKKKQRVRRVVFPQVSDATAEDFNTTAVDFPRMINATAVDFPQARDATAEDFKTGSTTSKDFNATAVGSPATSKGSLATSKGSAVGSAEDFKTGSTTSKGSPKNSRDFDISDDDKPLRTATTATTSKTDGLIVPRAFFDTLLVLIDETREHCGMNGDFDSVPPAVLVIAATRWLAIVGQKRRTALQMQAEFLEALGTSDDFQKSNEKQLGRYIAAERKAEFKKYVGRTYDDFARRVASCNA